MIFYLSKITLSTREILLNILTWTF